VGDEPVMKDYKEEGDGKNFKYLGRTFCQNIAKNTLEGGFYTLPLLILINLNFLNLN